MRFDFIEDKIALKGVGNFRVTGRLARCLSDKGPDGLNSFRNWSSGGYFCFQTSVPYQYINEISQLFKIA